MRPSGKRVALVAGAAFCSSLLLALWNVSLENVDWWRWVLLLLAVVLGAYVVWDLLRLVKTYRVLALWPVFALRSDLERIMQEALERAVMNVVQGSDDPLVVSVKLVYRQAHLTTDMPGRVLVHVRVVNNVGFLPDKSALGAPTREDQDGGSVATLAAGTTIARGPVTRVEPVGETPVNLVFQVLSEVPLEKVRKQQAADLRNSFRKDTAEALNPLCKSAHRIFLERDAIWKAAYEQWVLDH